MSCLNRGIVGEIADRLTPSIVKDSDTYLVVQMLYRGTSQPASFQTLQGATGHFQGEDAAIISIPATLVSADLGKLQIDLPASSTALLEAGDEQSFQVDFRDDRGLVKILFDGALEIVEPLYP